MSGKGASACTSALSAGLFGRYDRIANTLIEEADLLFVVGCKLGEIATKRFTVPPKGKTIIHLDVVAEEMGRTLMPALSLWGDARATLDELRGVLAGSGMKERLASWAAEVPERMAGWRRDVDARLTSDEQPVNMARLLHELNRTLPADAILVADGGFAAHWGGLQIGRASCRVRVCQYV